MKKIALLATILLWCALLFDCASDDDDDDSTTPGSSDPSGMCDALAERIEILSEDSFIIAGCFYPAENTGALTPSLLMLHQLNGTHADFDSLARRMNLIGYSVLTLDLRGHGESTHYDTGDNEDSVLGEVLVDNMTDVNFQFMAWDVKAAVDAMVDRGLSRDRIAIIGASIGANLALAYMGDQYGPGGDPQIKTAALLSPGEEYHGINIATAMASYGSRPVLAMATSGDTYSADMVSTIEGQAAGTAIVYTYEGSAAHGIEILNEVSEATADLTDFFQNLMPPISNKQ